MSRFSHTRLGIQKIMERLLNSLDLPTSPDTHSTCNLLETARMRLMDSLYIIHVHLHQLPGSILNERWDRAIIVDCVHQIGDRIDFDDKKQQAHCEFIMHMILLFNFYERYFLSHSVFDIPSSAEYRHIQQLISADLILLA